MLWLAAHFPKLGFETQRDDDDSGKQRPVKQRPAVLVHDNRIVQVDERAQLAGIAVGSTLATAHSIAPELIHFQRNAEMEVKRLEVLGQASYRYSSQVSLALPDALLIEGRGSLRLFGGLTAFKEAVGKLYEHLGYEHRLAAAPTPLAALILARAGLGEVSGTPMTILPSVPLAYTGLPGKELERLANMGISRLGQLLELPKAELGKRFSAELVDYISRVTGRRADPRQSIEPEERFHSRLHLLEPIRGKDALLFPMRRLADELSRWLTDRCLGTRTLSWSYAPFSGRALTLEVRLADPRTDAKSFLALSELQLDRARLPEEVMSVALQAGLITPVTPAVADLLAQADNRRSASRAELVDRLTAKLGDDAITGLCVADDHRPERAWHWQTPAGRRRSRAEAKPTREIDRPLWLLDPPCPVNAKQFKLLHGPERIESGWWEDSSASLERDYFVALAKSGARCWLYRNRDRRWYLHGYFS